MAAALVASALCTPARAQTLAPGWTVTRTTSTVAGTVTFGAGALAISTTGLGVEGTTDASTFVHRRIAGPATIIARLDAAGSSALHQGGLMVRESLLAGGRNAFLFRNLTGSLTLSHRVTSAGGTVTNATVDVVEGGTAIWLKLDRRGDTLTAYQSADGAQWIAVGSARIDLLTNYIYVGLAAASGGATQATASFREVVVIGNGTLDAGLIGRDVGTPPLTGGSWSESGTAILDGAGTGVGGTSDQFRYVYRAMTGDMDVVARVADWGDAPSGARAGLMARRGLNAGTTHFSLLTAPDGALETAGRTTAASLTTQTGGMLTSGAAWLRLRRRGSLVSALRSTDGLTWVEAGSQEMTDATYNVGLVVTSADPARLARVTFDGVAILANQAPTTVLSEPATDVTVIAPAVLTLAADAADADGSVAKVDFYVGDTLVGTDTTSPYAISWTAGAVGTFAARAVATDNLGATATSAARTVLVVSNAAPTVALTAPANGLVAGFPATITLRATAADTDGTIVKVDFYVNGLLVRSDTASPFRFGWTPKSLGAYTITAVATDDRGGTATTAPRIVTLVPNTPPSVTLTTSVDVTRVVMPVTITLQATAKDVDGTVARVEFYAGTTLLRVDKSSPYAFTWAPATPGTYVLTAVAVDNSGGVTATPPRSAEVVIAPPTVTLTAPVDGTVLTQPSAVTLAATATAGSAPIASVEFYAGGVLLGTDPTSPYTFNWTNPQPGTYRIIAVARDTSGASAVAPASVLAIANAGTPTTAIFTPASIHDVVDRYVLDIYPYGSDPALTAATATVDLGYAPVVDGECHVDIRAAIAALPPGYYVGVVTAQSTQEGSFSSAPSPVFVR